MYVHLLKNNLMKLFKNIIPIPMELIKAHLLVIHNPYGYSGTNKTLNRSTLQAVTYHFNLRY